MNERKLAATLRRENRLLDVGRMTPAGVTEVTSAPDGTPILRERDPEEYRRARAAEHAQRTATPSPKRPLSQTPTSATPTTQSPPKPHLETSPAPLLPLPQKRH